MAGLRDAFEERLFEVETYLDFLQSMEEQARRGPPRLSGAEHPISVQQQKMLYSGVYLQLYNLIESTMTRCIDDIAAAAKRGETWKPQNLSEPLRSEWVRGMARTHVELTQDNRLKAALDLCGHLMASLPITEFRIEKGGGGNWDDQTIEQVSKRLGFRLNVSKTAMRGVKERLKDDMGSLALVKDLRNRLAHGSISFTECAGEVSVDQLRDLKDRTVNYLREVVGCIVAYVDAFEYLAPECRPVGAK